MITSTEVEYRDIPNFAGYRAGSDGSVWSCWGPRGADCEPVWRRLTPCWCKRNRAFRLTLSRGRGRPTLFVATLILEAFVGPRPAGLECCHGDGDSRNNRPGNLRWETHAENMKVNALHGNCARGERVAGAKLTEAAVREIRELLAAGMPMRKVASRFGVSVQPIHAIASGKAWTHVA